MNNLRISTLVVSASLVVSLLAGCGPKESAKNPNLSDKTPITFTYYAADKNPNSAFEDDIAKEITKATGVTIKYQMPVDGGSSMIALMIASKEYPDLIYAKGESAKLIEAGALLRLDDPKKNLIEQAPNVKKIFGNYMQRLKYSLQDPSVYVLGNNTPGGERWDASSYFWIQNAALKDLGYPKIKNVKDYEKAITDYVNKYPTIDGKKTIGMSLNMDQYAWMISLGNPAGFALGVQDDGEWAIDQNTYKATFKYLLPEMREYYRWLNGMNAKGLIDSDSFTQKSDAYTAKLTTGRVVATLNASWAIGNIQSSLIRDGKAERSYATFPVVLDETKYKDPTMVKQAYVGGGYGTGISVSCKNPERAMQYINYICSEEFQIMNSWGIKGRDYTVDDKGKRIQTEATKTARKSNKNFQLETGITLHGWPLPTINGTQKDSKGNYFGTNSPESITENYSSAAKETLAAYGVQKWMDFFPKESEFKEPPYGAAWMTGFATDSEESVTFKKAEDYCAMMLAKAVLVSPDKFDATWDEIQDQIKKLGMEKVGENFSKLIEDRIKLWTSK